MNNPSGKKLDKLIFGMFDQMIEGADKYVTEQGSTWLIFTEDKRWVVEFTKDKTLWFNYNLFQNELDLVSKDCTQERDLIKNWFESRFLGIKPVEDTIQNGVRHTWITYNQPPVRVEDTIQNGVRHTDYFEYTNNTLVEDTIQEGVKHIKYLLSKHQPNVEDTIQNSVKETRTFNSPPIKYIEDTIQNGVKETTPSGYLGSIEMKGKIVHQIESPKQNNEVEDTIQNGVRHTEVDGMRIRRGVKDAIQNGVKEARDVTFLNKMFIEETIENGVKDGI